MKIERLMELSGQQGPGPTLTESKEDFWTTFDDTAEQNAEDHLSFEISKLIKMDVNIELSKAPKGRKGEMGLTLSSSDLSAKMKPKMFKSLTISDFGGNVTDDGHYWIPINYKFSSFGGGDNGSEIANIFLNSDGTIAKIKAIIK